MAGFRIPGPLGFNAGDPPIDDGTLCRQAASPPGTVSYGFVPKQVRHDSRIQKPKVPVLREYDRGPRVALLQKMLNKCVVPSPRLRIDGMFGSLTKQAVRAFQAAKHLYVDGTVKSSTLPRSNARAIWEAADGPVPDGFDVDHIIQRQHGGTTELSNLQLKPSGLNRSEGASARWLTGDDPYGTVYTNAKMNGQP